MKKYPLIIMLFISAHVAATEWEPLNKEKSQTLEQHCTVVSIMAGLIMQARQAGASLDQLMALAKTSLNKEITMNAFESPKMSTAENQKSYETEFKSQWMLKCLKEHPAALQ